LGAQNRARSEGIAANGDRDRAMTTVAGSASSPLAAPCPDVEENLAKLAEKALHGELR